jgi:hypothetical protein
VSTSRTLHTAYVRRSGGIATYVYCSYFTATRAYCTRPYDQGGLIHAGNL